MNNDAFFPATAPDFHDPLGLLRACHERIFQQCDLVERLSHHIAENGVDEEACNSAAKIYRYFSTAARHHHADEELDLFPRLVRHSVKLTDTIYQLKQEHAELDALWQSIEEHLAKPTSIEDFDDFQTLTQHFAEAYRAHAEKENKEVLDSAQQLFSRDELNQLGRSMAERRGVSLPQDF